MDTIFSVRNEHLESFTPDEAVDLFRELLWAEATATGIGINLISVPSAITVADGGIDAEVVEGQPQGGQGLIKTGLTRYQIKTGSFSLSGTADIKDVLFRDGTSMLKPRIKSCLDSDGTLVVVLFGSDNPDTSDDQAKQKFIGILEEVEEKYTHSKIEIWRQNHLRGFLSRFPSLALRTTGRDHMYFQSHFSWASQDDMVREFQEGEAQRTLVESLRSNIRNANSAVHLRLWGEAGIGKTRLALEATRAEDLAPLVVYCDSADKFRDSDLMNELLREDNNFATILVVDECDPDSRSYIWNKFKHFDARIRVVSLYGEYDITTGDISYVQAPSLDKDQVVGILQSYDLPQDQAERWSEICSGSPRVAHVIGSNLVSNPQDLLRPLDTVNIWARYIEGGDPPNSDSVLNRQLVLRYIALFKRFGYGRPLITEAQAIARLVMKADPSITWTRFQEIIEDLRTKRILQGETTLYVTPRALHLWLWLDWWRYYGNFFDYKDFSEDLPPQLITWFGEMFQYAAGSPAASKVVEELLGPEGPFADEDFLQTRAGADFFLNLSLADPKSALAYLQRTVGSWNRQKLFEFSSGRTQVIWALRNIAVWRDLFPGAALLLLALAETENDFLISNNSSGEFKGLFAVGPGPVASTEAPPRDRWPILRDALRSPSRERRRLGIGACDSALESQHWTRFVGPENQGLRPGADLWRPETYGELWQAYRDVWMVLFASLDELDDDDRDLAVEVLLNRARGLATIDELSDMVLSSMRGLIADSRMDNKKILSEVVQILHYEGSELPVETKNQWELIRDELTGNDFSSLVKRYVGMDLLEDHFDEQGNQVDQVQPKLEQLARQTVDDPSLLGAQLDWIVTKEAPNGFPFGYELGMCDTNQILLPRLLQAQMRTAEEGTLYFLGGYLRAYKELDEDGWENLLDDLATGEETFSWVPELTLRSGRFSEKGARRILDLIDAGAIPVTQIRMFVFGGLVRDVSEEVFGNWMKQLLASSDASAFTTALQVFMTYYKDRTPHEPLPTGLTLDLLTREDLFESGPPGRFRNLSHTWAAIGKDFLRDHPKESLVIAEKMLLHWGQSGTIVERSCSEARMVIDDITRQFPSDVWSMVSKLVEQPTRTTSFHLRHWLRGDNMFRAGKSSMINVFPADRIWDWVDDNPFARAPLLAEFVPPALPEEGSDTCLAKELLIRYGDRKDVRIRLQINFDTEGWMGSQSAHFTRKKDKLLAVRDSESNPNVILWIDEYTESLNLGMERAVLEEERRGL